MKRLFSLCLAILLLALCGCQGNFGNVDLRKPVEVPQDGIISAQILKQIKDDRAIAAFYGESNGYQYEWTIFGSDIVSPQEINLLVEIQKTGDGISISCSQQGEFGFPAMLSLYTGEKWVALQATAYQRTQAMQSVSITGIKESILNLSLKSGVQNWTIRPDEMPTEATSPAHTDGTPSQPPLEHEPDDYLSAVQGGSDRVYSDGTGTGQDDYKTDPIPEGKPMPVEPDDQEVDTRKTFTCTFSIECSTILNNLPDLNPEKREMVPSYGIIFPTTTVTFYDGESVFDVLQRICKENNIHMEASWTPMYNSAYVEGIHNLYEFDCGNESGWMYRVNGWYPNYGCSRYQLAQGDVVEWRFTCKGLGADIGCDWMG